MIATPMPTLILFLNAKLIRINSLRLNWLGAVEVALCWWWDNEIESANSNIDENINIDFYNDALDNLILRPSIHYPESIISTHLFGGATNFDSFSNYYDFKRKSDLGVFNTIQVDNLDTFQKVIIDMVILANYSSQLISLTNESIN